MSVQQGGAALLSASDGRCPSGHTQSPRRAWLSLPTLAWRLVPRGHPSVPESFDTLPGLAVVVPATTPTAPPPPNQSQFLVSGTKHSCQNSLPWRESFPFAHEGTETSSFRSGLSVSLWPSRERLTGFATLGTWVSGGPEGTLWNSLRLFCVKVPRQWGWCYPWVRVPRHLGFLPGCWGVVTHLAPLSPCKVRQIVVVASFPWELSSP